MGVLESAPQGDRERSGDSEGRSGISGKAFGSFRERLGGDFRGLGTVLGRLGGDFLEFLTKWATELRTSIDVVRQEEVMAGGSRRVGRRGGVGRVRGYLGLGED